MPNAETYDEQRLLRQLAEHDDSVITLIYKKYWERLFSSAYRVLRDRAACEDIVQDIFVKLWLRRGELNITTSLEGYLFTAVRYQVFQAIQRGVVHESLFENLEQRLWAPSETETRIFQKELQANVLNIVSDLPERCQQIYRLSREEQLSHKEIAERLSINTKTVENQLTIALRRIRAGLPELAILIATLVEKKF